MPNPMGSAGQDRSGRVASVNINRTILQVAAILIAAGVLLKLFRMRSQAVDDRSFTRLRDEVDSLELPEEDRDTLRGVVDLAHQLATGARDSAAEAAPAR